MYNVVGFIFLALRDVVVMKHLTYEWYALVQAILILKSLLRGSSS